MAEPINQRIAVQNLQRYLRRLSYEDNDISPIPIDGIFASRTTEALSEFQRMKGLPVTGRADRVTWDALFADYERLTREEDRRSTPEFFPSVPRNYKTVSGERGAFIQILQFVLSELTQIYDTLPLVSLTGIIDPPTEAAVLSFQRLNALDETGQVDRSTWNRMVEEYNRFIS